MLREAGPSAVGYTPSPPHATVVAAMAVLIVVQLRRVPPLCLDAHPDQISVRHLRL
jgi:hypothetical protein